MSKMTYEVVMKSVTWFIIAAQVRQEATDEADAGLTESIRQFGVLQPVGALPTGKLAWGHRRVSCAIAAGLKEMPVIILHKDMTEGEFFILQMLENVQRADLSQYDLWQGTLRLIETNKGWQLKDVAKALSMDAGYVTRIMSPSKVVPSAVAALKAGTINLGHTYAISKVDEPAEQERLLLLALAGASRDKLAAEARKSKAPAKGEVVRTSRLQVPLPSGVCLTVAGESLSLEDLIDSLAEAQREAKRAREQGLDAKTFQAVMRDKAKAK